MKYCDSCPYPAKCDQRSRCQVGNALVADPIVISEPEAEKPKAEKPKTVKKKGLK